ncbi:MAG: MFS transporter [Thermovirga sp.]
MFHPVNRPSNTLSGKSLLWDKNLNIIFAITLMSVLGVASIAPAFPLISARFGVTKVQTGWLVSTFTIPGLLFTPLLGIMADRFGRKQILIPSLFLFGISGGSCFFVHDFRTLLILRFMQGCGAATLNSLNVTLIGDLFHEDARPIAMGYNASILSIGTATYPALGGLLAMLGWNYPFILAFLGIPTGFIVLLYLDHKPLPQGSPTSRGTLRKALTCPLTLVLLTTSTIMFVIYYGAFLTYMPFYLAEKFGASPMAIGLVSAGMSLSSAATASQTRRLNTLFSRRARLATAFGTYALGLLLILHLSSCRAMLLPALCFGLGQGINLPTLTIMLTEIAPPENRAVFLSLNSMSLRLGQTLGPLLMGMIYTAWGIRTVFYSGTLLSIAMGILLLLFIRG